MDDHIYRKEKMAKIKNTEAAWDERTLGADEAYVAVADATHEHALEDALQLQAVSIRLPRELIKQYKLIGHFHGKGYQPLMRDVLARFVPHALKEILEEETKKAVEADTAKSKKAPLLKKAA